MRNLFDNFVSNYQNQANSGLVVAPTINPLNAPPVIKEEKQQRLKPLTPITE